mmetsp:Transcript_111100/g.313432  ORF Transcript_111100/g.313432 Transcript_111100/m.313432 type:complete len:230 (-) Transcript_111100:492-1181(-)
MLLVVGVLALVLLAFRKAVPATAMYRSLLPVAIEERFLPRGVSAVPVDDVVYPSTRVLRAVQPTVASIPVLSSARKLSTVGGVRLCGFYAVAVLLVIQPLAAVRHDTFAVVHALTVGQKVSPLPNVHVALWVLEPPMATRRVALPLAFVLGAARPTHPTMAMPHVVEPLPGVSGPGQEIIRFPAHHAAPPLDRLELQALLVVVAELVANRNELLLLELRKHRLAANCHR